MIQSFKMAMRSIAGNKLRAFLTMLGIIIGVMALVILVSLTNGATGSVTDRINSLGSNLLTVTISDDKNKPVTLEVLDEWMGEDGIGEIAASSQTSATGKYDSTNDTVQVIGTTPAYEDIQGLSLLIGRFIKSSDIDNSTRVCVISETTAEDLIGFIDCVGEEISLDGLKYTVVGVLEDDEDSLTSMFGSDQLVAYIPYTSLMRLSKEVSSAITDFYVSAEEDGTMEEAQEKMTELLMERFEDDEDAFTVESTDALENTMSSVTSTLTMLLAGIAAISLVVGGIGIMNIMLVTVTERTKEIGIRKAIGATRGTILSQFLMESVALCMMGCAIGVFLSWAVLRIATVITTSLSMTFSIQWNVVAIAVVFCFMIGLVFGLYPANKAAKMQPIDALHFS